MLNLNSKQNYEHNQVFSKHHAEPAEAGRDYRHCPRADEQGRDQRGVVKHISDTGGGTSPDDEEPSCE